MKLSIAKHDPPNDPEPSITDNMQPGERARYGPAKEIDLAKIEGEAFDRWLLSDDAIDPRGLVGAWGQDARDRMFRGK